MSRQVLDEQIDVEWYRILKQRHPFDKVGDGFGRKGLQDEAIYRLLHGTGKTFHSQDSDYYHPRNRHKNYCLVCYEVRDAELVDRFKSRHNCASLTSSNFTIVPSCLFASKTLALLRIYRCDILLPTIFNLKDNDALHRISVFIEADVSCNAVDTNHF